ncbi:uncharacterized protein B0I36DRAFT_57840 [Microdochium trichocladiopsis]|uniref:Chromo domain-containing protein n=1 Tax=Microdochium trichocladiopsis TaxID=1682393 RepID=A0A9P8XPW2_9PEZI|nr:uncharacterized protein B0I36DRAFT_57840 [Microdochium trichocladiopsis]KAH7010629.1 hypothetical protein B0I36DRAFT_57840 [Microdochium trichocladiopsis]
MSSLFSSLGTTISKALSPKKPKPEEPSDKMVPSSDSERRGQKRKSDIYDVTDDIEDERAASTPKSGRAPRSIRPGSVTASGSKIKRRYRLSAAQNDISRDVDPRVDAPANLERAFAPDAVRLQQPDLHDHGSVIAAVPVADMGGTADLFSPPINEKTEVPSSSPVNSHLPPKEAGPKSPAAPEAAQESVKAEAGGEAEITEVQALLDHKMLEDDSVDLLVHWAGERAEESTWEPEQEIQDGASELLYSYWKKAGGRTETLFQTMTEVYHVFRILNREKKPRGGFVLEVQWVGYPATKGNTSWEGEAKLEQIAPDLLKEYWDSVGGRQKFLAKRGRTKKN